MVCGMSEPIPTAIQVLTRTDKVQRTGWCPTHGNRSSKWLGIQPSLIDEATYWRFTCKTADHAMHTFLNLPDPQAPAVGMVEAWIFLQKSARLADALKGKKKAGQ